MDISKIVNFIHIVRGQRIMLDRDLTHLYGVPTKALNLAVKRNALRFPSDFMFVLTPTEAMLSSVLNSERAIRVNIEIM